MTGWSWVAVLLLVGRGFPCAGPVFRHTGSGHRGVFVSLWWCGCLVAGGAGVCLLFVNCIVDASIFVAKFFRAHGGCLGIRSR